MLTNFLLCGLAVLVGPNLASGIESERRMSSMLPTCDSERPNSWATHRTLTLPDSCLTGSVAETSMANALCCVYTHVVVGSGSTASFETYDGSMYMIDDCGTSKTSVEVMEDVMDSICGMSMGSQDCYNQRVCVENARTTSAPSLVPTPVQSTNPTNPVPSVAPTPKTTLTTKKQKRYKRAKKRRK